MTTLPQKSSLPWSRWSILVGFSALLIALPVFSVNIPPVSDLAQNIAQVRLLLETLGGQESLYEVRWHTPYLLVYLLMVPIWQLFDPMQVGRVVLVVLGCLWVLSIFLLGRRHKRDPAAAVLASLFFFNLITYWGFLSFSLGFCVFIGWFVLTTNVEASRSPSLGSALLLLSGAVLLYVTHILWLGAGLLWLAVDTLLFRRSWRRATVRAAAVLPLVAAALLWYPTLTESGFDSQIAWNVTPTARLSWDWLSGAVLGGIGGGVEHLLLIVAILWVAAGLWTSRDELEQEIDWELLAAAATLGVLVLFLPNFMQNTIVFAARWAPCAVIFVLLALPAPRLTTRVRYALVGAVAVAFCLTTAVTWIDFEDVEFSGLHSALEALPEEPRVIGLSLRRKSTVIEGSSVYPWHPFIQTFAYAQVAKGGQLNFSFAEFGSMPVVFRDRDAHVQWTPGLEWYPQRAKRSDFEQFDFALINGSPEVHAHTTNIPVLTPVTHEGFWRLYEVRQ